MKRSLFWLWPLAALCNLRNLWICIWSLCRAPHLSLSPWERTKIQSPTAKREARPVETLAPGHSYDEIDESNHLSRIWFTRRPQV
jgi:hypothetical protein